MENTTQQNDEKSKAQVQNSDEISEISDKNHLEDWKNFLDENLGEALRKYSKISEELSPVPVSILMPDLKKFEQGTFPKDMAKVLDNQIWKPISCSNYLYYLNPDKEIEELLQVIFPDYYAPGKNEVRQQLSFVIYDRNQRNRKLNENVQRKLTAAFDLVRESEFQRLKKIAGKCAPEPIAWTSNCEQLYNKYFEGTILSIPFVPPAYGTHDHDIQFQKECLEASLKKIQTVCTATDFTSSLVNEYSQSMNLELEKIGYFLSETDFTHCHETILLSICNKKSELKSKSNSNSLAKNFETAWNRLDDLTKYLLCIYNEKFRIQNRRICKEQEQIVEKAMDFALEKYKIFIDQAKVEYSGSDFDSTAGTGTGTGIFKRSQLLNFHLNGQLKIEYCFTKNPQFKHSVSWEKSWEKLKEKLEQIMQEDLERNQSKIDRMKRQEKFVMTTAENMYQNIMNDFISSSSSSSSISQDRIQLELERFHVEAVKCVQEFYEKKLEKLHQFHNYRGNGNDNKDEDEDEEQEQEQEKKEDKETLKSKCLEIKQQLVRENEEKIVSEMKEKEKEKEREQEQQEKKEKETEEKLQESQQQKPRSLTLSFCDKHNATGGITTTVNGLTFVNLPPGVKTSGTWAEFFATYAEVNEKCKSKITVTGAGAGEEAKCTFENEEILKELTSISKQLTKK